jgi:hypothetical protein
MRVFWSQRARVDYTFRKRATLAALFQGLSSAMDACDADPYLRRAAKFHGEKTDRQCPVCKSRKMVELRYTFGDQLGQYSGRLKSLEELREMQSEFGEFRVYEVEVCNDCGWNHLVSSFLLGDGVNRKPPRKTRTIEDEMAG